MTKPYHDESTGLDVHGPFIKVFADAVELAADAGPYFSHQSLAGGNNPAFAVQLDTQAVYYLSNHSPVTWTYVNATVTLTGDVVGSGTGSIAVSIANNAVTLAQIDDIGTATILGRVSGGIGDPEELSSAQATSILTNVVGDSGSGGTKGLVPAPSAGDAAANKFLKANGNWAVVGGGDVTGPSSSTDNAVARMDGTTGKVIQNSTVTISDTGDIATTGTVDGRDVSADGSTLDSHVANVSNPHSVTASQIGAFGNTELKVEDADASNTLAIRPASDLTGNRTLNIATGDTSRTLTFTADASIGGTNTGDQTITLTGDVTGSGTGSFAATVANDAITFAKMQNIATARFVGRTTAGTGDPEELSGSQATALLSNFVGDSGSGGTKGLVPAPAAGDAAASKFLKADGTWTAVTSTGDVSGPASSTDNAVVRMDGTTGKVVQNSTVIISDTGDISTSGTVDGRDVSADGAILDAHVANISNPHSVTASQIGSFGNTELKVLDTNASHTLTLKPGSDLTGNRTLTLTTGDADRTITLSGDTTLSGTNTGDQTITLTGDVTGSGTGSFAATVADDAITFAKMQNIATARFVGRTTASSGDPEELTGTQATALLDSVVGDSGSGGTKGLVPAPAAGDSAALKFLKASGSFATVPGTVTFVAFSATNASYTLTGTLLGIFMRGAAAGGGSGGGGAAGASGNIGGGGGGAGGKAGGCARFDFMPITAASGDSLAITIGAGGTGGTGGTGAGNQGNSGGATKVDNNTTGRQLMRMPAQATGGNGGGAGTAGGATGGAGGTVASSNGAHAGNVFNAGIGNSAGGGAGGTGAAGTAGSNKGAVSSTYMGDSAAITSVSGGSAGALGGATHGGGGGGGAGSSSFGGDEVETLIGAQPATSGAGSGRGGDGGAGGAGNASGAGSQGIVGSDGSTGSMGRGGGGAGGGGGGGAGSTSGGAARAGGSGGTGSDGAVILVVRGV